MERKSCLACGGENLLTDLSCLKCGAALHRSASRIAAEPTEEAPARVTWWDTQQGQRRIAFLSGAVMLACLLFLLPGLLMTFGGLIVGLCVIGGFWELRDREANRAFTRGVERGGGDRAAVQAELARHHRPDRMVNYGHGTVPVRGFDSRLGSDEKKS